MTIAAAVDRVRIAMIEGSFFACGQDRCSVRCRAAVRLFGLGGIASGRDGLMREMAHQMPRDPVHIV
jgi:hypothetical protein